MAHAESESGDVFGFCAGLAGEAMTFGLRFSPQSCGIQFKA